ncbi:MAG: hypothetical protein IIU65_03290, partial [Clostridia bacterium]|nr:hypothetical protein [Clostridia bacterium]
MKKYPIFFLLAIIILIVSVITPNAVYASLPKVKYIKAVKNPYAISSNAIVTALGKRTGMPKIKERTRGRVKPTIPPYILPHT